MNRRVHPPEIATVKTDLDLVRKTVHKRIASQLKTVEAKLDRLKARAGDAKSNADRKAIAQLRTTNRVIQRKLNALKKSGQGEWEQARGDLETQIADFQKSLRGIESRIKGR